MLAEILFAAAPGLPSLPAPSDAELAARALSWLEPRVDGAPWSKSDASKANVGGKRVVVDALLGWLELVRDDRTADEALLARLDARIRSHLGDKSGTMGAFANWTDGIAALYCAERELRKRGGRDALEQIARGFEARQNSEGGWDHGATFGLSFYPSTLVATTNLSLIALGFAQRFGVTHDSDAIASGLALLGDVQGEGGGMPYGGRPYMKGVEAARTCGTVLALSSLGLGTDPRCTRAAGYVLRNIDAIPEGHASTAFHVFMGALACSALGPAASESFDERILARVRAAQREDGSFDSIVPGSPDDMAFMADADTNRAYITAFHAAALLARSSKIAAALQLSPPAVADQDKPASRPMLLPIWSIPMPRAGLVAFVGERVLALDDAGHGRWLSAIDGEATGTLGLALGTQPGELQCAADDSGVLVWKAPSGSDAPIFIGGGVSGSAQSDAHPTALAFVSVDAGGPHWSRMLDGRVLAAILAGQHVVVRTIGGRIIVLARKDGTTVRELPALGVLPNVALCRGANDTLVMAAESRIACVEMLEHPVAQAADATVWERKNRLRGLIPPAWTAIATDGDSIVAGRTDGTIAALDISDGATRWEGRTGSSIRRVAADPASVRVFALTHDGRLLALDAGKIAWTRDVEVGHESHAEPALLCTPGHIWIASPATNALMCLDPGDGRILGTLVWSSDLFWSARERTVVVADAGGVDAFRAP